MTLTDAEPARRSTTALPAPIVKHWPLIVGFLLMAVPTLIVMGRESWSREEGAHGPIVLATGIWLLWQIRARLFADAKPMSLGWVAVLLLPALLLYIPARAYDLLMFEVMGLYGVMLIIAARFVGVRSLLRNFFPFFYLAFLIPIPGWVLQRITGPLQELVSWAATGVLSMLGYPVAREGVVIYIAQYQLLVEDACAGMNSLVGLIAISLFYIYIIHRASWRYAAVLLAAVVPIAIIANIIRVIVLILLTYYKGDAVAQGFLHNTAGILLFALALAMVVLLDMVLRRWFVRGKAA